MNLEVWDNNPELKKRFEKIIEDQRRLQLLLGLQPKTLEQRITEYQEKKRLEAEALAKQQRLQSELAKIKSPTFSRLPIRRPIK